MTDTDELQRQIDDVRVMAEDALDKFPLRNTTTPGAGRERHIHDLGKHPGGVIAARVFNSGAITISTATNTVLTFDSERFDTDTIHSTSSNTGRLTAKTAGKYVIVGNIEWAQAGAAGRLLVIIRVNGSTQIGGIADLAEAMANLQTATTIFDLKVDDYVELVVRQETGSDLNVLASSNFTPEFSMARIGAAGTIGGGVPGTDHGALNGLGDDDHSLYLLAGGSREGSTGSAQNFGSTGIKTDILDEATVNAGVTLSANLLIPATRDLIVGHSGPISMGELFSKIQLSGANEPDASMSIGLFSTTDALSPILKLIKSGNATIGSNTTVANNEELGKVQAYGADGTDLDTLVAEIAFNVDDASIAAGQIGGEIILATATSGGVLTTALTISAAQLATFAGDLDVSGLVKFTLNNTTVQTDAEYIRGASTGGEFHIDARDDVIVNVDTNANTTNAGLIVRANAASTDELRISESGSIFIDEKAAADADVADKGQIWVKTVTPNELFFTDDAGTDEQIVLASQVQDSQYVFAADAEASDTYVITLTPAPAAYVTGQLFHFNANTANTGAATLNVNGLGATTIKKLHDQDLATNDIESGQIVTVIYDGTNFQMQSQIAAAGGGGGQDLATDTLWAAQGDLVKGTGNDAADILTIGADHTILVSNGSDPSWSAAPPLANIADTGDTNRITLATSSPEVSVTGDLDVSGRLNLAGGAFTTGYQITISPTLTTVENWRGISIVPTITTSTINKNFEGIAGSVIVLYSVNQSTMFGLRFAAIARPTATGTTLGVFSSCQIDTRIINQSGTAATITDMSMFDALTANFHTQVSGTSTVTELFGLHIRAIAKSTANLVVTNAYGIKIEDWSGTSFGTSTGLHIDNSEDFAINVDSGLSKFDGDGTDVFELPADATDPTSGGGAATGRIPVKIGGSTVYLAYY